MWKRRIPLIISLAFIAVFMLFGCAASTDPSAYPTPILRKTAQDPVNSPLTSPTPKITRSTQTPPQLTADFVDDLSPDELVSTVVEDLAKRISLDPKKISLVEATRTNWSDAGLGCHEPGIEYSQVVTPGFRIILEAQGQLYEYHTGQDEFVLCEQNQPSIDPVPVMPIAPHGKPPKCQWTACPYYKRAALAGGSFDYSRLMDQGIKSLIQSNTSGMSTRDE